MNPIEYIKDRESNDLWESGYTTPGWYFWDESWSYCYGPYESEEIAKKKLEDYCEECL